MQSEAGAAGAVHGALQGGALATTFTASQGLLLMLPEMFKIAGELQPCVVPRRGPRRRRACALDLRRPLRRLRGPADRLRHSRRRLGAGGAGHGRARLHDQSREPRAVPALLRRLPHLARDQRDRRALGRRPARAGRRGAGGGAEAAGALARPSRACAARPRTRTSSSRRARRRLPSTRRCRACSKRRCSASRAAPAAATGRSSTSAIREAERVVVAMGSATATVEAAVRRLNAEGERVGLVNVRLYRPFSSRHLAAVLPFSTRAVAVLDRAKDSAAVGEPLYEDVVTALHEEGRLPRTVIGGRYGLGSKEFTPAMACAVFDELAHAAARTTCEHVHRDLDVRPHRHFTVGIDDDVSGTSLAYDPAWRVPQHERRAASSTGSAPTAPSARTRTRPRSSPTEAGRYVQAYFVYDSKKSGAVTVSHLRFGDDPIEAPYLIEEADFVACHQFQLLERRRRARARASRRDRSCSPAPTASTPGGACRGRCRSRSSSKQLRLYVVDAKRVAREAGLAGRVNTVLQTCFFALSGRATGRGGDRGDQARDREDLRPQGRGDGQAQLRRRRRRPRRPAGDRAGRAERCAARSTCTATRLRVLQALLTGHGDELPVSAFDPGGVFPTGTAHYERRALADELPVWDPSICIDCAKCTLVCPHAAIRMKVCEPELLAQAPGRLQEQALAGQGPARQAAGDRRLAARLHRLQALRHRLSRLLEDANRTTARSRCTRPRRSASRRERDWEFFRSLPELDRTLVEPASIKGSQLLEPLFEFSGACSGCGETPYLKLLTQLVGDRLVVANATGCSSIYGGNLPTTPWAAERGRARPGLGELPVRGQRRVRARAATQPRPATARGAHAPRPARPARRRSRRACASRSPTRPPCSARERWSSELKALLAERGRMPQRAGSALLADSLVEKSVWLVGGDGWAYDIGFGGLDHVLASGRNVKVLVLDTEVYSNTGGQASKATPARRGGEVRLRRQAHPQEGPRPARDGLRRRLRRPDRARRRQRPGRAGPLRRPSTIQAPRS